MRNNKYLATIIAINLKKAGSRLDLSLIPSSELSILFEHSNILERYNLDEVKTHLATMQDETSVEVLDGNGVNPLYNLLQRELVNIGRSIAEENEDYDILNLLRDLSIAEEKYNELRAKVTDVFREEEYKNIIEDYINDAKTIVDTAERYLAVKVRDRNSDEEGVIL